jgi:hypothetical protein
VIDEAHHLLPASWEPGPAVLPESLDRLLFITVHPEMVARRALEAVNVVVAVGKSPRHTIEEFCRAVGESAPPVPSGDMGSDEVFYWSRKTGLACRLRLQLPRGERRRHIRKYAEGELPPERSFYFRGPEEKLNLRAQNLFLFLQLADGIDDATWLHHLRQGDYSRWFRVNIKDDELASEAATVESRRDLSPQESRAQIRAAIERHYTLPAGPPLPMPGTDVPPKLQP